MSIKSTTASFVILISESKDKIALHHPIIINIVIFFNIDIFLTFKELIMKKKKKKNQNNFKY